MKKLLLLLLISSPVLVFSAKLNITLSKNSLNLDAKDSIIYKFYLPSSAKTTIKFINIYGGEEIDFEIGKDRAKGWHEVKLHSDSLKKHFGELSSGVYYIEFIGLKDGVPFVEFNSYQSPWGNIVTAENMVLDSINGKISYTLNENCIAKTRVGYPNGALVRTISFGLPKAIGPHTEYWDGFDQSGKVSAKNMQGLIAQVLAYAIPKTAFILNNPQAPVRLESEPIFPDSHTKYALSPNSKKSWKDDFDVVLDYKVNLKDGNMLSFLFGKQNERFTNSFNPENEIYIYIEGSPPVENPNVAIPGDYTISFAPIPKGQHLVLVNLILPDNRIAVGIKEIIIN